MISSISSRSLLIALSVEHPEWRPLLFVIEEALRETERPQWARCVPALEHASRSERPLLDGATITMGPTLVERWVRRILTVASGAGTTVEPLATAVAKGRMDPLCLFETMMSQDLMRLDELSRTSGGNAGALRGLALLIAMPMLQACRRTWVDRLPHDWTRGYCPVCGGWPALAEIRGLDGSRHLRCGSCGSDWQVEILRCPFCGEDEHGSLGSLVSPDSLERQSIDVCDGCRGYVKTITTLTAIRPDHVLLQDLATLVLDMAALERGYRRPAAKERAVAVRVVAEPSRLRDLLGSQR